MDEIFATELSKKLQIDIEQIVREEYEMLFLKELFESKIGKNLVFKGGTALRLCYGSPRFSQDLDFSSRKEIPKTGFFEIINSFPNKFPQIKIDDLFSKRFTSFALLKVQQDYLSRTFSVKIEISKRKETWQENRDFQSEITPLTFLAQVVTSEKILEDKLDILKRRQEPRDLFDIWFISQRLEKDIKIPFEKFKAKNLKRELHKFLPKPWWKIINQWKKEGKLK